MDYQLYALLGIATAGLIANEVLNYKNSQMINHYVGRFNEFIKKANEINARFFGISKPNKLEQTL